MADGRDLGALQLARLERFYAACPREVRESRKAQICILSGETGTVRTSAVVRYELAQLLALDDQNLESLRLHALNRELHPRFYRGRYRLAMSLEMIANPEHYLPSDVATLRKLAETLAIISRYGQEDGLLQEYAKGLRDNPDRYVAALSGGTSAWQVPQELALKLLEIAQEDLREVRAQLSLGRVLRDAFFRRDERAVWLPHRKRRYRKAFQDGVCAAELLVAIRCRLREPANTQPGWLRQARVRWYLRRAIKITRRIVGNPAFIGSALTNPHGNWWVPAAPEPGPDLFSGSRSWRRGNASWQAAYNTACLYAALADAAWRGGAPDDILRALERLIIVSLRCVVDNPRSELERAWDWFASDPDFRFMRHHRETFTAFEEFLNELERQEYPASMLGKCPVAHPNSAKSLGLAAIRVESLELAIFSPIPDPSPAGDGSAACD